MLNCWRVNELFDIPFVIVIQQLSAAFATKSLLELGGGVCDNLNFMNFKIDRFKIR